MNDREMTEKSVLYVGGKTEKLDCMQLSCILGFILKLDENLFF